MHAWTCKYVGKQIVYVSTHAFKSANCVTLTLRHQTLVKNRWDIT